MIRTIGLFCLFVVMVSAAAGCALSDGPLVVRNTDRGRVAEDLFFSASSQGPVLARLNGNPFGGDARTVVDRVHRAMADAVIGRVVRFTDDPAKAPQPRRYVAVVFGASPTLNGASVCEREGQALPAPRPSADPGRIDVRALFCGDGEVLSDAEGTVRGVSGPADPRFYRLFYDLADALLVDLAAPEGPWRREWEL